jgi:hypothetical protein
VINTEYDVSIDWERICEGGRAVVLFDGLDELSDADRINVLNKVVKFAARFRDAAFLLTVRDSAALTVPLAVPVLAINRLDDFAIKQFAEAYSRNGGNLSADVLSTHIRHHPDLGHLLRIPLFLALVLASVSPEDNLPCSRSELLEHYLTLLFSPERHKVMAAPLPLLDDLREATELLAWRGLETDGIGLSEVEAKRLLRGQGLNEKSDVYIERLVQIGVLRRIAARLRFAYPILQEYLAACWMIANAPKEIGPRFASISCRPWAQAVQFALEMHPEAGAIIKNQLNVQDDAFYTTLRLVARCIVNGAKVDPDVRSFVGNQLAEAWPSESYSIRNSIGYLIADGFLDPLPKKAVEHISRWALHSGGAEIVAAKLSPPLTRNILRSFLDQDITHRFYLYGWQHTVDDIADEALDYYLDRVRDGRTSEKELDSLSSLIAALSPALLRPNRWHEIAIDPILPSIIRLSGYHLSPSSVPSSAWVVINDVIRLSELDETRQYGNQVYALYWRMQDAESKFFQMLNDSSLSEKQIRTTLESLLKCVMETDVKRAILRRALNITNPAQNIRFLMLLCLAVWGDEEAEQETTPMLADQGIENVTAWLYQANKFCEKTVQDAAIILSERPFTSDQLLQIINTADFGLIYKTDVLGFDAAVGNDPYIHPAHSYMLGHLIKNLRDDDESIEALKIRVRFGDNTAREKMITEMRNILISFQEFMPFDDDQKISSALYTLGQSTSSSLPIDFLFQIVDKSSSNAGREAVSRIVRGGDEKIITPLLERYNSRSQDFVREAIFSELEVIAGRYGKRFIRENGKLIIE